MSPIVLPTPIQGGGGGSSEQIEFGLGTPPGGVESFFQYNGLMLNDRSNLDTYLVTGIDGLHDADIRDARDVNPSAHGETPFNAYYGGRTIVLNGKVRAHTIMKLRDMQNSLKLAFSPLEENPLRIMSNFNDVDVEIYCRKNQPIAMQEAQTNFQMSRDFMISLRASDPRFRSVIPVIVNATPSGATFAPVSVTHIGNINAQPLITITGPMSDPILTNATTGAFMNFDINLGAGDAIIINALDKTVTSQLGANLFYTMDVDSTWPELISGDNVLELTGTGISSGASLTVNFKHTWL